MKQDKDIKALRILAAEGWTIVRLQAIRDGKSTKPADEALKQINKK